MLSIKVKLSTIPLS